jgi:hypothetical protein
VGFVIKINLILTLVFLTQACSSITNETVKNKPVWRFGIVRVDVTGDDRGAKINEITTVGLWVGETGSGVGFSKSKMISLDDSCRLVIIVKNSDQLENLMDFLGKSEILNGNQLCTAIE